MRRCWARHFGTVSVPCACAVFIGALFLASAEAARGRGPAVQEEEGGWQIPPGAEEEKNPVTSSPQVLAAGRALFRKNCQRCHGPKGVGDGPDADPDHMADMDLTNPKRAAENPDGVVFHKIWNGRQKPKMPTFKDELSREQVWTIVTYVQTLRQQTGP